jgi:hypothetical protein
VNSILVSLVEVGGKVGCCVVGGREREVDLVETVGSSREESVEVTLE